MKCSALLVSVGLLSLAACQKQAAAPAEAPATVLTEDEATAIADATQAAWTSVDLAKEEAVYAKDVVAFDPEAAPLSTDWTNWDTLQKHFIDYKFDGITVPDRKIQVLDDDTFLVSGTGTLTSKDGPMKEAAMRF